MNTNLDSKKFLLFMLIPLIMVQNYVSVGYDSSSWENDKTAVVSRVIDGDTFDTTSDDRIRLADINAPEQGESGYNEARDLLISVVDEKQVYLDIDDISRIDQHGRLVCVVYVEYNSTHLMTVNKALLVQGVAEIWDHTNNEFNPYGWTLYVQKISTPKFPIVAIFAILLLTVLILLTIALSRAR